MSSARLTVRAVVVSDGKSSRLAAVLDAVTAQDPLPDHIDLVLCGDAQEPLLPSTPPISVVRSDASHVGRAIDDALALAPGRAGEMLWLLHDDSAPLPGALAHLTATARKRHRAEVVGAAQVQWDDPARLVSLGTTTTRVGARRVTLVDENDVNQGQYDARDDVLAVSLAGALVRRDTWHRLEGLDPAYAGWGDSLDFCRRVWRSGGDVVAVPRARIRHAQERLYARRGEDQGSRRDTYSARRAAEWFHALAYSPWWMTPLVLVAAFLSSGWRAVTRVVRNDARMLAAELAVPARLTGMLPRLWRSRRRVTSSAGRGRGSRAAERRLLATGAQVRHDMRVREWGEYETWRAASAPTDVVRAELDHSRRRTWRAFAITGVALAAVSATLHGDWILGILRGQMLAGDVLGVTDMSVGDVWDRGLGGWTEQGLGAPAVDGGLAPLLLPLSVVPGGLAAGVGLLLGLAPLWAGLAAWAASGAISRSVVFRASAAVAYAVMPSFIVSVEQGRITAVMVHALLPLAVLGIIRAAGWHRGERVGAGEHFPVRPQPSPSAGMAGAVALALCTIASPLLALPALAGLLVLALITPGRRAGLLALAIPTLAVALPGWVAAVSQGIATPDAWSVIAREPGPSLASGSSVLDILMNPWGTAPGVPEVLAAVSASVVPVVLVAAAAALLGGRRWRVTTAGVVAMAAGMMVAAAQAATAVSPDSGAGTASANGWAGPGLSVLAIGVMLVTGAGLDGAWRVGTGAVRVLVRGGAVTVTAMVAVAVMGHVATLVWPGREEPTTVSAIPRDVIPLVAALEQHQPTRQRVLVLGDDDGVVTAAVLATDGSEVISSAGELLADGRAAARSTGATVNGVATLDDAIARMLGGEAGAGDSLVDWGIGVVVASPGADALEDSLAQSPDLTLLGSSDRGTSWRLQRADAVAVSRAWVETDGGVTPATMGRSGGAVDVDGAGTAVIAVAQDEAWTATLDGVALERIEDPVGRVAFAVPGAGHLHFDYDDTAHRVWWWLGAGAIVWALLGAIPLRARGFKETRA
ncbi:glycosyltransferase family 2 protein [Demequina sp. NBRC 110055]|uniref:glycosyltransferase family 2 protein n=1 Tax=Demequina sp. NBRC 110055 TaxID=1570344 RepID=UPI0009FE88E9|nr:glycosyltransferase [Demequina sp. NBRC 110055]